jgi:cell division protein FtsQ
VAVTGLRSEEAPRVRRALTAAAQGMTTLNVREERLRQAAADFAVVQDIETSVAFPRTLRIRVTERRPVVSLETPGARPVPVAPDGTLLRDLRPAGELPQVRAREAVAGDRTDDPATRQLIAVAAAAPAPLAARIERVTRARRRGLVVVFRDGPQLWFGTPDRVTAKWAAATRVMAEPSAVGAQYVDVRLPDLPTAGPLSDGAGRDAEGDATTLE